MCLCSRRVLLGCWWSLGCARANTEAQLKGCTSSNGLASARLPGAKLHSCICEARKGTLTTKQVQQ